MSDAMISYSGLPEAGYPHGVVVHKTEFVSSEDTSVHTAHPEHWSTSQMAEDGN